MAKQAKTSNSDDDDRISDLPDDIRCNIVSVLPIIDAVNTTRLSTKWKNYWTIAVNDFTLSDYGVSSFKFVRFVNKLFLFHNAPVIKRFLLDCREDSSVYDYDSWIDNVVRKKIEELCLYIMDNVEFVQLPASVFTCQTLNILILCGNISVREFTSYSLPKLKKLKLKLVTYENKEAARKLVSSCPSLESLSITRIMDDGVKNFVISSSTLKVLKIDRTYLFETDFSTHVINSPSLEHLKLINGPANGFVIEDLSSLVKTEISLLDIERPDDSFYNILRGVCNSKILNISTCILQSSVPGCFFPNFDRLSALQVTTICCNWDYLQAVILKSVRLETLEFTKLPPCLRDEHVECWRNPATIPICLSSSLKTVTFVGFDGLEDELSMVEYILKNAKVLQKMEIRFEKTEPELCRKLLQLPTGSEECQVIIS